MQLSMGTKLKQRWRWLCVPHMKANEDLDVNLTHRMLYAVWRCSIVHLRERWVGSRATLDILKYRKISLSLSGIEPWRSGHPAHSLVTIMTTSKFPNSKQWVLNWDDKIQSVFKGLYVKLLKCSGHVKQRDGSKNTKNGIQIKIYKKQSYQIIYKMVQPGTGRCHLWEESNEILETDWREKLRLHRLFMHQTS